MVRSDSDRVLSEREKLGQRAKSMKIRSVMVVSNLGNDGCDGGSGGGDGGGGSGGGGGGEGEVIDGRVVVVERKRRERRVMGRNVLGFTWWWNWWL